MADVVPGIIGLVIQPDYDIPLPGDVTETLDHRQPNADGKLLFILKPVVETVQPRFLVVLHGHHPSFFVHALESDPRKLSIVEAHIVEKRVKIPLEGLFHRGAQTSRPFHGYITPLYGGEHLPVIEHFHRTCVSEFFRQVVYPLMVIELKPSQAVWFLIVGIQDFKMPRLKFIPE